MTSRLLLLGLAGALGTLSRYGLGRLIQQTSGSTFPAGTLVVNVLGCFLFGLIWAASEKQIWLDEQTKWLVLVGFLGAFTTFSTFAMDTTDLFRNGEWLTASLNVLLSNGLGIAAAFAGVGLVRVFR